MGSSIVWTIMASALVSIAHSNPVHRNTEINPYFKISGTVRLASVEGHQSMRFCHQNLSNILTELCTKGYNSNSKKRSSIDLTGNPNQPLTEAILNSNNRK